MKMYSGGVNGRHLGRHLISLAPNYKKIANVLSVDSCAESMFNEQNNSENLNSANTILCNFVGGDVFRERERERDRERSEDWKLKAK